ncbi:MAG: winged helix-turn-helix transcriptional regulator [Caldilineaceae bacterium]|nr:winged helix-turn-helix transcriptional regulator [Caldilineaceae bacterium]
MDALGHQTRRTILDLLHNGPQAVGALAGHLPISRPAVSKHLRILEEAKLVAHTSQGASNIFYLNQEGFAAARTYIDSLWGDALTRYQQVAELMAEVEETMHSQDRPERAP